MDRCSQCGTTERVEHFFLSSGQPEKLEIALCCDCYHTSEYYDPECCCSEAH